MCRTGGRRCDTKWDNTHRERYNARRRIVRNTEKAQTARAADDDSKASYYDRLVADAEAAATRYDEAIRAHEAEHDTPVLDSVNPSQETNPVPRDESHPLAAKPSEPMDMNFIRNPVSSTSHAVNHDFGQDIEPSGRYLTQSDGPTPDGWESGSVRFEKPLHMDFGASGLYSNDDNWKRQLSAHYEGKTGAALSEAVRADGYDAIVTHDKYGTSEIVDLTNGKPQAASGPKASAWDRRRKYEPKNARDLGRHLEDKHGVTMRVGGGSSADSYVTLSQIEVPKERRGAGVGKAAMQDLVDEADRNGWKLALTPSGDYGGSVPKLKRFYKAFGFVENKGRNKDFTTRETYLRPSQ